jgi:hypothetical protein
VADDEPGALAVDAEDIKFADELMAGFTAELAIELISAILDSLVTGGGGLDELIKGTVVEVVEEEVIGIDEVRKSEKAVATIWPMVVPIPRVSNCAPESPQHESVTELLAAQQ